MRHLLTLPALAAPVPATDPPARDEFRNRLAPDPAGDRLVVLTLDGTSTGDGGLPKDGPVVLPDGTTHDWPIRYVPVGAGGRLTVTWDGREQPLEVPADHRRQGAKLDRFGLFNIQSGGHHDRLTLTDRRFTTEPAGR
jgi:hypothetical protein